MMTLAITLRDLNLSLVSIFVVFIALLLLFGLYSICGAAFKKRARKRREVISRAAKASGNAEKEKAAAIAVAIELSMKGSPLSPVITFGKNPGIWNNKSLSFRKKAK